MCVHYKIEVFSKKHSILILDPSNGIIICRDSLNRIMLSLLARTTHCQLVTSQQIVKFSPVLVNRFSSSTFMKAQVPRMEQVEEDEMDVQKKLGKINMDFVRKAEKRNKERATMHR